MKRRPLLYRSPSRQPRQAIAPAQYSNSNCVSRLRATLYIKIVSEGRMESRLCREAQEAQCLAKAAPAEYSLPPPSDEKEI